MAQEIEDIHDGEMLLELFWSVFFDIRGVKCLALRNFVCLFALKFFFFFSNKHAQWILGRDPSIFVGCDSGREFEVEVVDPSLSKKMVILRGIKA